jgi:glucose-6-phosphate 1-epimerase
LNQHFGIPGIAQVVEGNGGLPKVSISAPAVSGEIYLHGAQVTSWRPAAADEVIFLSRHSKWEDGRAIRGGIPVCFPWFRGKADDPKAPAHGFVRTRSWSLESVTAQADDSVVVVCSTESDESTRLWWPHHFRLVHRITVGKTLRMELTAVNTGTTAFRFEGALHTYFRVGDVEQVSVDGLDGVAYLDNMDGNREKTQTGEIRLSAQTDNAYLKTAAPTHIVDPVFVRVLRTHKENSATTIVWNPWSEAAARLADLGGQEWRSMICVEAGNILGASVGLSPGGEHTLRSTLSVANL